MKRVLIAMGPSNYYVRKTCIYSTLPCCTPYIFWILLCVRKNKLFYSPVEKLILNPNHEVLVLLLNYSFLILCFLTLVFIKETQ